MPYELDQHHDCTFRTRYVEIQKLLHDALGAPPDDTSTGTVAAVQTVIDQRDEARAGLTQYENDGFHTNDELYLHRHALFIALVRSHPKLSWRTKAHHPDDAPMYAGYFLVTLDPPAVGPMGYHMPLPYWQHFDGIYEAEHAPRWDGYSADDTHQRLVNWARTL